MEKIRCAANLQTDSVVDGPGLRLVLWTQGCFHNCKGCHNALSQDPQGGFDVSIPSILEEIKENDYHDGITFSGGEPLLQAEKLVPIAKYAKSLGLNIWCYTGFLWEDIQKSQRDLLQFVDVLVDGKFVEEKKTLAIKFQGSSNQRRIDVKNSLLKNEIILI